MRIDLLEPADKAAAVAGLADVLLDCVADGASVGFLDSLTVEEAWSWWTGSLAVASTRTWVARDDDGVIVGCIQLLPTSYPNGRHRADVAKLLVHRSARRRGVAAALMDTLEAAALASGRTLLMLDTETGSPAETLYALRGWQTYGVIDGHAVRPDGRLAPTTFFLKRL